MTNIITITTGGSPSEKVEITKEQVQEMIADWYRRDEVKENKVKVSKSTVVALREGRKLGIPDPVLIEIGLKVCKEFFK